MKRSVQLAIAPPNVKGKLWNTVPCCGHVKSTSVFASEIVAKGTDLGDDIFGSNFPWGSRGPVDLFFPSHSQSKVQVQFSTEFAMVTDTPETWAYILTLCLNPRSLSPVSGTPLQVQFSTESDASN